jgi:hypothetical protein
MFRTLFITTTWITQTLRPRFDVVKLSQRPPNPGADLHQVSNQVFLSVFQASAPSHEYIHPDSNYGRCHHSSKQKTQLLWSRPLADSRASLSHEGRAADQRQSQK